MFNFVLNEIKRWS